MRLFADATAKKATQVITKEELVVKEEEVKQVEIYLDRCTYLCLDKAILEKNEISSHLYPFEQY